MAVKKKAKKKLKLKSKPQPKTKKKKRSAAKKTVRAKLVKKSSKKKTQNKKTLKKKPSASKPTVKRSSPAVKSGTAVNTAPAGAIRVGIVTHYFSHLMVAVVKVEAGMLREGDTIHIKGHTSDFQQRAGSMELEHVQVPVANAGQSVGMKVVQHAREHDVVYRVDAIKRV